MARILLGQLIAVGKKALSPADIQWLQAHIAEGAPGITPFLSSESLVALVQLFNDTYRSFIRGEVK